MVKLGGNFWWCGRCAKWHWRRLLRADPCCFVTIVEHADQRKSVNQIAQVLVPHQLAEHCSGGLQLAWGEMLLPTDHKDHVLDDSVVELLLRRAVNGMRKVSACDNGADVLLNLRNLHGLGG